MALGYRAAVESALEGRGWNNERLAQAVNELFELSPDGDREMVTAADIYEWKRAENEPRAGLTLAILTVLNLLHLHPFKFGFARSRKESRK